MILILTVMPWSKYAQILGQIYGTIAVIYYLSAFKPFTDGFMNLQERVNEITVLLAAYPLFVFTDWVPDDDRKMEAGWYLVSCILLNILFNIAVLVYFLCKDLIRKLKRKWIINNKKIELERKLQKEKEEQEALKKRQEVIAGLFHMKTGENMIGQGVFRDTDDQIPGVVEAKLRNIKQLD